jgi:hypothetical protein
LFTFDLLFCFQGFQTAEDSPNCSHHDFLFTLEIGGGAWQRVGAWNDGADVILIDVVTAKATVPHPTLLARVN